MGCPVYSKFTRRELGTVLAKILTGSSPASPLPRMLQEEAEEQRGAARRSAEDQGPWAAPVRPPPAAPLVAQARG